MPYARTTLRLILPLWSSCAGSTLAQQADRLDPDKVQAATQAFTEISRDVQALGDWSDQAALFETIMDQAWRDNQWDSEPDRFARELASAVTRIPPWQFNDRMNKMTDMIGERYNLDTGQRARFQARIMREAAGFAISNAEVIASQARDFVDMRRTNQPFTAERIAKWTRESDPLLADGWVRMDRVAENMKRDMNPDQKRLLQKDYERFDRRMDDFLKRRDAWAKGEWSPREWGLHKDPAHSPAARRAAVTNPDAAARLRPDATPGHTDSVIIPADIARDRDRRRPPDALPHNESTWARYIRKFIQRHRLDAGQRDAAHSILAELEARAAQYRLKHAAAINAIPPNEHDTADKLAPIRAMFDELKARADALLTRIQRDKKKD